ncbi:hypothetical protein FA13DRAFT_1787112 [Coprinellus micaceus]|uniref:Uncharacterized protein n=1 Tax=Coprinellus micaceus TaxID=71717 RepID=A0A4Y7TS75_COPMI|nr:hypothetical protein FA13DRAFT_1787112 [Coprinellus micaceus]
MAKIRGKSVWRHLPFACTIPAHDEWTDPRVIEGLRKEVHTGALAEIQRKFDGSSKLYLLHGRLESDEGGGRRRVVVTSKLRDYLRLENPNHRKALTRVLVSAHKFAVEILQYAKNPVPREERVCRYGCEMVETPEHVWLSCMGSEELVELRKELHQRLVALCSEDEVVMLMTLDNDPTVQFRVLMDLSQCVATLAEYAYGVEKILKKSPLARR